MAKFVTEGGWFASIQAQENRCFQWLSALQVLKQLQASSSKFGFFAFPCFGEDASRTHYALDFSEL